MDKIKRIIDVNLNRFNEGMRVIEELFRFYFDDPQMTKISKTFRHDFTSFLKKRFKITQLYISRDIAMDVGKTISTEEEIIRIGVEDIFYANAGRVKEAIRTVEEYLKLYDKELSKKVERLRYRFYDIEKKMAEFFNKKSKIFYSKKIYPIFSPIAYNKKFKDVIDILKNFNIAVLQLRMKESETDEFYKTAKYIREELPDTVLVINDRLDIAISIGANGIHIGENDLPYKKVKELVDDSMLIGVSARNEKELKKYSETGADYIGVGPIYKTKTKKDAGREIGEDIAIELAKKYSSHFIVGIGGINRCRAKRLLNSGINMIAGVSDIFNGNVEENLKGYIDDFGEEGVLL